jgi:TPP-dependent pyruvate/acetoin dehydrogenase alpha subunit
MPADLSAERQSPASRALLGSLRPGTFAIAMSLPPPSAVPEPARTHASAPSLELYRGMLLARRTAEKTRALWREGEVHGPGHLADGQEAVSVGAAAPLRDGDASIGTYRGHAHALARGADPEAILRELLGRAGGVCGGKGGSMHITSVEHGYYGSYAIVGGHLPIACGLAWAQKLRGSGQVTMCFFGDGATNIGAFHEALNLAAVWRLPVVFVCENNLYMEYTPIGDVTAVARPAADRAAAYGLQPIVVDGNDVEAVEMVIGEHVERARGDRGPALIEALTYRLGGHSLADPAAYRPPEEVEGWQRRDPILRFRAALLARGGTAEDLDAVDEEVTRRVDEAGARALAAPRPPAAEAWTDVWADGTSRWRR